MRSVKRLFVRPRVTTESVRLSAPRRRQFSQSPDGRTADGRATEDGIPGAKTTLHKGDEGGRHEKPLNSRTALRAPSQSRSPPPPTQMQLPLPEWRDGKQQLVTHLRRARMCTKWLPERSSLPAEKERLR